MSSTPSRPETKPAVDEETRQIIEQRLATFDEDRKTAVDAREALATIRKNIKHPRITLTPVRLTKVALADIEKAVALYEGQKKGLGGALVDRVMEAVENIGINPLGYEKRIKDVRMAVVPKFPCGL